MIREYKLSSFIAITDQLLMYIDFKIIISLINSEIIDTNILPLKMNQSAIREFIESKVGMVPIVDYKITIRIIFFSINVIGLQFMRNHVKLGVSLRVLYCVVDTCYGLGRSLGDCRSALPKGRKYQMVKTR